MNNLLQIFSVKSFIYLYYRSLQPCKGALYSVSSGAPEDILPEVFHTPVKTAFGLHQVHEKPACFPKLAAANRNRQRSILSALTPLVKRFLVLRDHFLYIVFRVGTKAQFSY
ncbi:MAG TPA: hypothetical protein VN538_10890 [Clostridia bacterium]|nr:hypothetical protein [Clostridia bacterium]